MGRKEGSPLVDKRKQKKIAMWASIAGVVLAVTCQVVPPKYQAACNLVAQIAPHACS